LGRKLVYVSVKQLKAFQAMVYITINYRWLYSSRIVCNKAGMSFSPGNILLLPKKAIIVPIIPPQFE
jgi:hypothetical protein